MVGEADASLADPDGIELCLAWGMLFWQLETGGAVIAAVHARALSNAQAARAGERRVCPHRESSYDGGGGP